MAILLNENSRVLIVGGTSGYGANQLEWMRRAGTNIVGLISPGHSGEPVGDLPAFDLIEQAVQATGANAAILYVPAPGVRDALVEAADAGLGLVVAVAELVPVHDTIWATAYAREHGTWVVGPNTAGIASPGKALLGSIPQDFTTPGPVGVMSRSGTLSIISSRILTLGGFGQTTVVAMGGDTVIGQPLVEYFKQFAADPETRAIVYLGEVGGAQEYDLLPLIKATKKPVVTAIVGRSAPPGQGDGSCRRADPKRPRDRRRQARGAARGGRDRGRLGR